MADYEIEAMERVCVLKEVAANDYLRKKLNDTVVTVMPCERYMRQWQYIQQSNVPEASVYRHGRIFLYDRTLNRQQLRDDKKGKLGELCEEQATLIDAGVEILKAFRQLDDNLRLKDIADMLMTMCGEEVKGLELRLGSQERELVPLKTIIKYNGQEIPDQLIAGLYK